MKKLFFLLAVFACTLTAGAQNKGYNHVNFGYNGYLVDNFPDMHGFRVGYARGINLKSTLPLYIEVGGQFVYGYNSYRAEKYDYIRLAIPVNVTYRFSVGDNWKIAPYAGLALGINCLAQERETSTSLFDFRDTSRVQATWQAGCNFTFKKLLLGLEYGIDLNNIAPDMDSMHFAMNVGLEF